MTASNHVAAGALIGAVINPWLAAPAAVTSHFVLDAMPHYGYEGERELKRLKLSLFRLVLIMDVI